MTNLIYNDISVQLEEKIRGMEVGEKLPSERTMAEMFGVSRNMLRESLRLLSEKGIIEIRPGKGVYVADKKDKKLVEQLESLLFDQENSLIDIVEARETLELAVLLKAVEKADREDIQTLEEIFKHMEEARNNVKVFNEHDIEFHVRLAKSTKNSMFPLLISTLYNLTDRKLFRLTELYPSRVVSAQREHRSIISAIRNRDMELAREVARKHFNIKDILDGKTHD
jgi:Transcriptional regulators